LAEIVCLIIAEIERRGKDADKVLRWLLWPGGSDMIKKIVDILLDFGMVIRIVEKVDQSRSAQDAIDATGRQQYISRSVVDGMPRGVKAAGSKIKFFELELSKRGGYISDDDIEKEFKLRNLVPESPYLLAKVNEDDPAFADEYPNTTHWKDSEGKWCYMTFYRGEDGKRFVDVFRREGGCHGRWWFAGHEQEELLVE
jgi:hypothetical protein